MNTTFTGLNLPTVYSPRKNITRPKQAGQTAEEIV